MKRGTGRHDKVLEFACELGVPVYAAVGILNLIWEWASESKPRGDIGRASNRVIATMAGWPTDDADRLIEMLIKSKLVDEIEGEDRLYIHDWHDHCDNGVHTWLGRRGLRFANGNPPSTNHLRSDERKQIEAKYGPVLDSSKKGPKKVHEHSTSKTCARMDGTAPAPAPAPAPVRDDDESKPAASSRPADSICEAIERKFLDPDGNSLTGASEMYQARQRIDILLRDKWRDGTCADFAPDLVKLIDSENFVSVRGAVRFIESVCRRCRRDGCLPSDPMRSGRGLAIQRDSEPEVSDVWSKVK